jgi:peroxiredoxin (alkyl hydroperoxide reductase subunit C)
MLSEHPPLPKIGDRAPQFEVLTPKGLVSFPEFSQGYWCIFFAHPANFTSAWRMYSNFLAMKERWLNERNTKLLVLANESIRQNDWSDIVRRYLGIFLKAPVIEDPEHTIAKLYGMATGRRITPPTDRLLYIIDPEGIIRLILRRPLASIQTTITDLERALDHLQGNTSLDKVVPLDAVAQLLDAADQLDGKDGYKPKPAYFGRTKINLN